MIFDIGKGVKIRKVARVHIDSRTRQGGIFPIAHDVPRGTDVDSGHDGCVLPASMGQRDG